MKRREIVVCLSIAIACCLCLVEPVDAQGLIWKLPEDGTWVRYEGTYTQTELRPDAAEGDLKIEWLRHLTIKSVGREEAEYAGQTVPCRWIEIKSETGLESEQGLDPGPVGSRILLVLIPESRVTGNLVDSDQIPVSFLPIIKGYRKTGQGDVKPITTGVLQVYPTISLLPHFRTIVAEADQADEIDIEDNTVSAKRYKGVFKMESPTSRSLNESQLWRSDDVPFGLAKWETQVVRESKDSADLREAFKATTEITVEMRAEEIGVDAERELIVSDDG